MGLQLRLVSTRSAEDRVSLAGHLTLLHVEAEQTPTARPLRTPKTQPLRCEKAFFFSSKLLPLQYISYLLSSAECREPTAKASVRTTFFLTTQCQKKHLYPLHHFLPPPSVFPSPLFLICRGCTFFFLILFLFFLIAVFTLLKEQERCNYTRHAHSPY